MLWFLLAAFVGLGWGQQRQQLDIPDFSGGLNTYQSPYLIAPNQAQKASNVILDHTGSLERRQGYTKLNTSAIGQAGGASDVNSVYRLEQSNGSKYCIAFSSTSGYSSVDGCQTFTQFVSTLTKNNDVNCDTYNDSLVCVNNQFNFFYNGLNTSSGIPAMPASMAYLRVHRNRCFAAGAGSSRLYYSVLGDCTNWNTSTDYIDIATNAGDVITGIGPDLYDVMPIYKKYSTWALKGVDANSFVLVNISPDTGAKNHRSIANLEGLQLFDSVGPNGGQSGIYAFDGVQIREMSRLLRNDLDLIDSFKQSTSRKTFGNADWTAGTYDPKAISVTRQVGAIQSSYTAVIDVVGPDFAGGYSAADNGWIGVSTSISPGDLTFAISTFQFANGDNRLVDFTNWTLIGSSWTHGAYGTETFFTPCRANGGGANIDAANGTESYLITDQYCMPNSLGNHVYSLAQLDPDGVQIKSCTMTYSSAIFQTTTCDSNGLVPFQALNGAATFFALNTNPATYPLSKMRFTSDSGESLTSITTFTANQIAIAMEVLNPSVYGACLGAPSNNVKVRTCADRSFVTHSTTFTSRVFDTYISSPVWGLFSSTYTFNSDVAIQFITQVASSPYGAWDSSATISTGFRVESSSKEYVRYSLIATHVTTGTVGAIFYATSTFIINAVEIDAASTGTWRSAETFLSNNITATGWGLFQTQDTTSGSQASIVYDLRVSSYSGGAAQAKPIAITAGSVITNSTGAYVIITATYTIGVATETAKTQSIVLNWNEGAQATAASAAVFQNRYHYGAQSQNGSRNDTIYIMSPSGSWVKWVNMSPRMLSVINQQLMMAGSSVTGGGFLYQLYNSDADDGSAIKAEWQSKDFDFGLPFNSKAIDSLYTVSQSNTGRLTLDLFADTGLTDQTFSVPMSTGASYQVKYIPTATTRSGRTFSFQLSNNAASAPWRVHRAGMTWHDLGTIQP